MKKPIIQMLNFKIITFKIGSTLIICLFSDKVAIDRAPRTDQDVSDPENKVQVKIFYALQKVSPKCPGPRPPKFRTRNEIRNISKRQQRKLEKTWNQPPCKNWFNPFSSDDFLKRNKMLFL